MHNQDSASSVAPEWIIALPGFVHVQVWVTFIAICFTCSHSDILFPPDFPIIGTPGKQRYITFCYKEPCHSNFFVVILGTTLLSTLRGMKGACHLEIVRGIKLSEDSRRQSYSNWNRNLSPWLLWGKHIAFCCHFKYWNTSQEKKGSSESLT